MDHHPWPKLLRWVKALKMSFWQGLHCYMDRTRPSRRWSAKQGAVAYKIPGARAWVCSVKIVGDEIVGVQRIFAHWTTTP